MSFPNSLEKNIKIEEKEKSEVGSKFYSLDSGLDIQVKWKEYTPQKNLKGEELLTQDKGIIMLPGWGMGVEDTTIENLSKEFAENSNMKTTSLSSRSMQSTPTHGENMLYEEAKAMSMFIREKGLKEVTLVGHSQGGDKAINIASILQQDPDLHIAGVILISAVGMYKQEPSDLVKNFSKDALINTPQSLIGQLPKNPGAMKSGISASMDILSTMVKEAWDSKGEYIDRFKREVKEMSAINPQMATITAPVVLISGAEDTVSNPEKIVPEEEEERILNENEGNGFIDPREEYLKANLFKQSPYVRLVAPEKLGHHGLPYFRGGSVARGSMYLLKRFNRRQKLPKSEEGQS